MMKVLNSSFLVKQETLTRLYFITFWNNSLSFFCLFQCHITRSLAPGRFMLNYWVKFWLLEQESFLRANNNIVYITGWKVAFCALTKDFDKGCTVLIKSHKVPRREKSTFAAVHKNPWLTHKKLFAQSNRGPGMSLIRKTLNFTYCIKHKTTVSVLPNF